MNPERYRRAGDLYHAARAIPPGRRREFLEHACAGDLSLLDDVESLLAADQQAEEFIESAHPAVSGLVQSLLGDASNAMGVGGPAVQAPPLVPGQRLGRYEVLDLLGAGGMGTVYRALDPSLGREIAIKALAPTFQGDSASLKRFEREARVLATLSHPNIATIYGFERLDGSPYLVLERVGGETLAERLRRGPLPADVAAGVAAQVAAGLEEAHAKGIVHRDLKPSNVMLTPEARVKLVDFGLAKSVETEGGHEQSSGPLTQAGVVLGTARYMSPEQVRGEPVDTGTDVWAFGCVLFEMLTGRPVFGGRTVSEVVAAVLRDEPDWSAVPGSTPPNVRRLLRRCLQRDRRSRLQHIGDARLELHETDDGAAGSVVPAAAPRAWRAPLAAAVLTAAGVGGLALVLWPGSAPVPQPMRLSLELPAGHTLAREFSAPFALAPSGSPIVVAAVEGGAQRLYVRALAEAALRPLAGTEGARQPFFSPDGAWIGFFANRKLSKVPASGGAVLTLADIGGNPRGASWASDSTIVVAPTQTSGLVRVPDAGGRPVALTTVDEAAGESSHRWPDVLPGGRWVLFTVGLEDASFDEGRIDAVSMATGERRSVLSRAGFARYMPGGRLLFLRGGRLHAVGFDPEGLRVRGTPEVVFDPIRYDWRNGGGHLAVSASGLMLYTPGEASSSEYYLSWGDAEGRLTRATDTPRAFRDIKVSPDARRIAAIVGTSIDSDLWIVDANGTLSRATFGLSPHRPAWTPRGDRIAVGARQEGRWRLLAVAASGPQYSAVLVESQNRLYPNAWSPDGRHLVFQENRPGTGWDLRVLDIDASGRATGTPRVFADTPFDESSAAISFDGRWIAYESDELDGVVQVYVRSFPDGGQKVRVSPAGARWPVWDAAGNLFYWQTEDNSLQQVATRAGGEQLVAGEPRSVWRGRLQEEMLTRVVITVAGARYDVDARGARFVLLERPVPSSPPPLAHPMLVTGWPPPGDSR